MAAELDAPTALQRLRAARRIVVLGASTRAGRAGDYVPAYLREQGYDLVPVNPRYAGQTLFDATVLASLDDVEGPVDLVDVFRRPADLPGHLEELIRLQPELVWLQQGIRHEGVAAALIEAGIDVVQDRCTLADLRAAGGGRGPGGAAGGSPGR